jgi:hypothetical protein
MIGFVFCILAALALGSILDLEKQLGAHRLEKSYLGNLAANRQILDQTTSAFYASLKADRNKEKEEREREKKEEKVEIPKPPAINPPCARLNLSPLIESNLVQDRVLYEMTAKLLKTFYGESLFENKPRAEYKFLDAVLAELRLQKSTLLEKVSFKDPCLQKLYYKMLKGTKDGVGYPSLLDYVKIENALSKICLYHAHPNLLSVFFTQKGALKIYEAMHHPKASILSQENIVRICQEVHAPLLDPKIFALLDTAPHTQSRMAKTTILGVDPETKVSLRKVVHSPRGREIMNELPSPR